MGADTWVGVGVPGRMFGSVLDLSDGRSADRSVRTCVCRGAGWGEGAG